MNFEDYESLPTQNFVTHMTAGAIAGVMEHCIMYPLDSVKLNYNQTQYEAEMQVLRCKLGQAEHSLEHYVAMYERTTEQTRELNLAMDALLRSQTRMQSLRTAHNSSISETFRYMVKREGLLRPVRGVGAVVAGAGPAHAFYFATYEHCKHELSHVTRHRHDHIVHGVSGCIASVVHDAVSNPAEVVKQRLQMLHSPYRGVWECVRGVWRREGLRAFYRSYPTQLAMNVPFQALHFVTYEWCTARLNPLRRYDPRAHATAGAVAGALAAAATTPLDVCKTLLNTQEAGVNTLPRAAAAVWRSGGSAAFFRGSSARVLYQMPAAAICWLTYETFKHALFTMESSSGGVSASPPASPCAPSSGPSAVASCPPPAPAAPPLACAALRLAAAADVPPPAAAARATS